MGYFDGLTSGWFHPAENGRTIFYPWGVFGKGRVLPDDETATRIRSVVRRNLQVSLVLIAVLGAFINWMYNIALVVVLVAWYYLWFRRSIAGYPVTERKLTIRQVSTASAAAFGQPILWALFFVSVLFVVAALWVTWLGPSSQNRMIGVLGALLFGAAAARFFYMLKLRPTGSSGAGVD